jgi:hypothetical protein
LPDIFFIEGELTSNGYQLTSQRGSIAEERRDKDKYIRNDLLAESQELEEQQTGTLDYFHAQR